MGVCSKPQGADAERPPSSGENYDWNAERQQAEVVAALERSNLPEEIKRIAHAAERMIRIGLFAHEKLPSWSTGRVRCCWVAPAAVGCPVLLLLPGPQAVSAQASSRSHLHF